MRNIKWALLGGVGVTTVAAGTMGGLYAHEVSKRVDRIADKHFKSILDNINHIREASGMNALSEDYDGFKDEIIQHVADKDTSLKEEVIDVLEATVTDATTETQKQIDANHDYQTEQKKLLKDELERLSSILHNELGEIQSGIVGDHDINYYRTLIMDSVGSTQFQDLSDDVDKLATQVGEIDTDVDNNSAKITEIKTIITDIEQKITTSDAKIQALDAAIDTLKKNTNADITHIKNSIKTMGDNLTATTDSIKTDLENIKISINNNTTTLTRLDGDVANMQQHIATNKQSLEDIKVEVNSLNNKYNSLSTATLANKTDIKAINDALGELVTADKGLNDKLSSQDNKITTLSSLYTDLEKLVNKNKNDILDLVLKYNNLDTNMTTKLAELKQFFVDGQTQQNLTVATEIANMELLILTNTNDIASLKTKVTDIQTYVTTNIATLKNEVNAINNTLKKYERKFAEIEIDLADAVQATDDLEVALRDEIDDNKAAILGLDTRIAALENAPGGSSTDMLYKSTRVQPGFGLDLWNRPFYSPQDLTKYRRFEMFGYSYSTGTYFSLDFNVDTTRRVFDFAGGERLHPNRGWWKMKIDYINKKMNFTFFQEAGNASWVWYDQRGRMDIYEIYGIK